MELTIKNFFGQDGLTQTSANHICNLAKEYYSNLEKKINNISGFTQEAKIIGSDDVMVTAVGTTKEEFNSIPDKLYKIAECKALCAYLREAIKERDRVYREITSYQKEHDLVRPCLEPTINEFDVLATWSVGQLTKYYELEAKCVAFGKYIHEDGSFNRFRDSYVLQLKAPVTISGKGRDLVSYMNTPTLSEEEINDMFFALQDEYRSAQAELNGMKHIIDTAIENDGIAKQQKYAKELNVYFEATSKVTNEQEEERQEALNKLQGLKIVIPNHLRNIYNEILSLSKK